MSMDPLLRWHRVARWIGLPSATYQERSELGMHVRHSPAMKDRSRIASFILDVYWNGQRILARGYEVRDAPILRFGPRRTGCLLLDNVAHQCGARTACFLWMRQDGSTTPRRTCLRTHLNPPKKIHGARPAEDIPIRPLPSPGGRLSMAVERVRLPISRESPCLGYYCRQHGS